MREQRKNKERTKNKKNSGIKGLVRNSSRELPPKVLFCSLPLFCNILLKTGEMLFLSLHNNYHSPQVSLGVAPKPTVSLFRALLFENCLKMLYKRLLLWRILSPTERFNISDSLDSRTKEQKVTDSCHSAVQWPNPPLGRNRLQIRFALKNWYGSALLSLGIK